MAADLTTLDPAITKLEFKVTVLPDDEPKVQEELRRTRVIPARRKVYFYDTATLDLAAESLSLRARVTDGDDDDSTVKFRPLPLPAIPAGWGDGARIELDVVGDRLVPSAKLDGKPDRGEIEEVEQGARKPGKLFNKAQEAVLPDDTDVDELEVLGPVDARKWTLPPGAFPYELAVEEWSLPDGTHFVELSFKAEPEEAVDAQAAFAALLAAWRIDPAGDQQPKTPRVLEFFAERLRAGHVG